MKRFALWAVVPALVAVAAVVYFAPPVCPPAMPAIAVTLTNGWAGGTQYLPAFNGARQSGKSSANSNYRLLYSVDETYSVASSNPTHLFVLAHYKIKQHGTVREVDRTLPVFSQRPDAQHWSKLGGDLMGYAYLSAANPIY
jgi:hypothetical protein